MADGVDRPESNIPYVDMGRRMERSRGLGARHVTKVNRRTWEILRALSRRKVSVDKHSSKETEMATRKSDES